MLRTTPTVIRLYMDIGGMNVIRSKKTFWRETQRNLTQNAVPRRSYECSAIDSRESREHTDGSDRNIYSFLDLSLYNVVTLLDRKRKTRINHQIREKRTLHYPENNVVTLSTVAPSVQNSVKQIQNQIQNPTSDFRTIIGHYRHHDRGYLRALGGNFIITLGDDGKPNGWAILDTDSIETGPKKHGVSLAGGLGHSSTGFNGPFSDYALTKDGKINASMILVESCGPI